MKTETGLNIIQILDYYGIKVNSAGFACCPFHHEKTPSMKIYERTNSFYCFGCHTGGDIITFVEKMENKEFKDCIDQIKRSFGIDIKNPNPQDISKIKKERRKLEFLEKFRYDTLSFIMSKIVKIDFSNEISDIKEKQFLEFLYDKINDRFLFFQKEICTENYIYENLTSTDILRLIYTNQLKMFKYTKYDINKYAKERIKVNKQFFELKRFEENVLNKIISSDQKADYKKKD